ncbi:MAG TPA: HIT domain-containing protein [Acidimicrobiia bacterium]|nr:HIT domain-containing protein [Acidimicrobiia bacterium]
MDHMWAGWRSRYVRSADEMNEAGCLFCRLPVEDDATALILERGAAAYSVLNRFPYSTGHLMVTQYRHAADLGDLTAAEAEEVWRLLARARRAFGNALKPDGFNLGANLGRIAGAGIPDHLHFHLVPRWAGDTSFMTTVGETRVIPEDLGVTWGLLRDALAGLD